MSKQIERELKLQVDPEDVPRLRRNPRVLALTRGGARTRRVRSRYFDTDDLRLRALGFSLRLRGSGRSSKQTLKGGGRTRDGLFERAEYETMIREPVPRVDAIPDPALRQRLQQELGERELVEIFETDVRRTRRLLVRGDEQLNFDLDVGAVRANRLEQPICELELELVRGSVDFLLDTAKEIQERVPLQPSTVSKADLGYALFERERGPTAESGDR